MFIRKKLNKSGSISVQVISKKNSHYKVMQTIGSSRDPDKIQSMLIKARSVLSQPDKQQQKLFALETPDYQLIKDFLTDLSNTDIHTIGPELIFGKIFDQIGFNIVPEKLFRHLVIARLCYPTSKLKTVDYLFRYKGETISVDSVYRFLDKLNNKYKQQVEAVAYNHSKKLLRNISIVFYDMTTLYFEAEDEDDLRKVGFSKDGKFQQPQIMLGLLVGTNGYPIGYDIFAGNTFEGHTLLPILKKIQQKYQFKQPVVVADAALLSKQNLTNLSSQNYKYIIGARIKNESDKLKKKILKHTNRMKDGEVIGIKRDDDTRLILSYSTVRAKKDAYNRQRGLLKLQTRIKSGKLTKASINNRGYNKYLILHGKMTVKISAVKVCADKKWDGLKGYITNTKVAGKKVIDNYRHLWQIEKAFRISKTDLKVRPIFHHLHHRIEAHICIAFVAYTIYKELERLLEKHKVGFSVKRAIELTHNMYELEVIFPQAVQKEKIYLKMSGDQQRLYEVIHNHL